MAPRSSKQSTDKNGKRGGDPFYPDLKEWKIACDHYINVRQIAEHFGKARETIYALLDRERCKEDEGKKSVILDHYIKGRRESRLKAIDNLKRLSDTGSEAAIIYSAKTIGGFIEAKDLEHIELKKKDQDLKNKQFLTDLAAKFELKYDELNAFAEKYFKDSKVDDI